MNQICDVLIVGTGAAGLFCALNFDQTVQVHMITKQKIDESDSFLAQGGICMLRTEEDYQNYFKDTLRAGHYENDKEAVNLMIRSSNHIIRDLIGYGVQFEKDEQGNLLFTKEGAHSQPRILFHEDETGKEITSTLLKRVQERKNIVIDEDTTMIDLITKDNTCSGIVVSNQEKGIYCIHANYVILATGGIGGLYQNSTNFPHITGDALAMALKHNIEVSHLDYIQIHPTTLYSKKPGRRFLISESVRGEGALLYDKDGNRFIDELLPRDVVSKAILNQMEKDQTEFVWEDLRPIGKETILSHFPNIYQHCLEEGFNCLEQPIPVVPAQHYHMGGIAVNLSSQTSMNHLYAIGEVSCNGVHGKNRLASNSLLESLVFAQRAADEIQNRYKQMIERIVPCMDNYKDIDTLFHSYHSLILEEIEKEKKGNLS